jgi:RimJ/RimL family protein N-acetyltransferase
MDIGFSAQGHKVVLRPVTPADARAMVDLIHTVAQEGVYFIVEPENVRTEVAQRESLEKVDPANECFFVAEVDGVVAGFVDAKRGASAKERHVATLGIALAPAYRSLGIGPKLMAALEDWARQVGVHKLSLGVFGTNDRARRMYERMGYEVEGIQRRHFLIQGQYVDDFLMAKWLG